MRFRLSHPARRAGVLAGVLAGVRAGALAGVLAGCAPQLPAPNTAVRVSAYLPGQNLPAAPAAAAWWGIFGNPALDALVQAGLAGNPSIAAARHHLQAARQNAAAENGVFLPQIALNPPGNNLISRQSYPSGPNGFPPYTIYEISGSISEDPGLFGARRNTYANAAALAEVQNAQCEAARQTVAANIVAGVIGLAGAQAQIATTNNIIAAQQSLLTLLQGEYADGAIAQLNVLQQQSQILSTQATLPRLRAQAAKLRDSLAILTGTLPQDFTAPAITAADLAIPRQIPVVLPSAYLAGRPDIRAARAQVAAQNAALGIAVAHLYPDLSLSAQGGYASESFNALFEPGAAFWTLAGNLLAPLYEGGVLHARKAQAQAQLAAALDDYHETVLTAFGEAADALQDVQNDQAALAQARLAAQTANQAYTLAQQQFQLGAVDYTTVLAAQASAAAQALALAQARSTLLLDIAALQSIMAA